MQKTESLLPDISLSTSIFWDPSPTGPSGAYHSDGQSDHVSTAADFEWEESGALWENGPLHKDHLIILAQVVLALALLGTQAGTEILEALVYLPGVQKGLWVSWVGHLLYCHFPPQPEPPALGTLTSGVPEYVFCFWSLAEVAAKERCPDPCRKKKGTR